jgi:hypothetical protein
MFTMIVFKNVEDYCGNHCYVCVLLTFYGNVLSLFFA